MAHKRKIFFFDCASTMKPKFWHTTAIAFSTIWLVWIGFAGDLGAEDASLEALDAERSKLDVAEKYNDAIPVARRALALSEATLGKDHVRTGDMAYFLGRNLARTGKDREAVPLLIRALTIAKRTREPDDISVAWRASWVADTLLDLNRYKEAEPYARATVRITALKRQPDHIEQAYALHNLGRCLRGQKRYREALPPYERALEIKAKQFGPSHFQVVLTSLHIGWVQLNLDNFDAAKHQFSSVLSALRIAFPNGHRDIGYALDGLGRTALYQWRFPEASKLLEEALAVKRKYLRHDDPQIAYSNSFLGALYASLGQHDKSAKAFRQALEILKKIRSPDHHEVAMASLAVGFGDLLSGKLSIGHKEIVRSYAALRKSLGEKHEQTASALSMLALSSLFNDDWDAAERQARKAVTLRKELKIQDKIVASILEFTLGTLSYFRDDLREAERRLRSAMRLQEQIAGYGTPFLATSLTLLAQIYIKNGLLDEARGLLLRAYRLMQSALPPDHYQLGVVQRSLAMLANERGNPKDAEARYRESLRIFQKNYKAGHFLTANVLGELAFIIDDLPGRLPEAIKLTRQSIAMHTALNNRPTVNSGIGHHNLAMQLEKQGRTEEALQAYETATGILRKFLGPQSPNLASTLKAHADYLLELSRPNAALPKFKEAVAILTARELAHSDQRRDARNVSENRLAFRGLIRAAWRLGAGAETNKKRIDTSPAETTAFETAQWLLRTQASNAVLKMATRNLAKDPATSRLMRERDAIAARWRSTDKQLAVALSGNGPTLNFNEVPKLRKRLDTAARALRDADKGIANELPQFSTLINPAPLSIKDAQLLLKDNEALIVTSDMYEGSKLPEETFVWIITKHRSRWIRSKLGTRSLKQRVSQLRRSLDPTAGGTRGALALGNSATGSFDFAVAHELYQQLLAPAQDVLKSKKHLFLVPSGPLTALPFHVLLTKPPSPSNQQTFRDAPWLVNQYAITTLPSVASLAALRRNKTRVRPKKEFIGFANPIFQITRESRPIKVAGSTNPKKIVRSYARYFRDSSGDAQALSNLTPLPDTEDEVREIAKIFGAQADIHSGQKASEAEIKRLPLEDYRIVHFATHGLIAGEVKGLAEPALALSLPRKATQLDDGLLTASEVATLQLNADWVILSACNTAAGDRPGAEALSGLARAFFYAGTRALLVSHWPVFSPAAVKLTTKTLTAIKNTPGLGRSEALRRAMLDIIKNGEVRETHPSYWAPFVVVGAGG
jgi:CHAT domain-containing protein/Tfp pilus assembly protein PilF